MGVRQRKALDPVVVMLEAGLCIGAAGFCSGGDWVLSCRGNMFLRTERFLVG